MNKKVITDNSSEKLVVQWDGERFSLILRKLVDGAGWIPSVIILNPKEMYDLIKFGGCLGKEDK